MLLNPCRTPSMLTVNSFNYYTARRSFSFHKIRFPVGEAWVFLAVEASREKRGAHNCETVGDCGWHFSAESGPQALPTVQILWQAAKVQVCLCFLKLFYNLPLSLATLGNFDLRSYIYVFCPLFLLTVKRKLRSFPLNSFTFPITRPRR